MHKYKIDQELINTIKWIYKDTKLCVGSEEIQIGTSVFQGGVISPTLFLITFNELIENLRKEKFEVMAYADDLVIVGNNKKEVTNAIRIVEKWTIKARMQINK